MEPLIEKQEALAEIVEEKAVKEDEKGKKGKGSRIKSKTKNK